MSADRINQLADEALDTLLANCCYWESQVRAINALRDAALAASQPQAVGKLPPACAAVQAMEREGLRVPDHLLVKARSEIVAALRAQPRPTVTACVRPGHPDVCNADPQVGCCYWRDAPNPKG